MKITPLESRDINGLSKVVETTRKLLTRFETEVAKYDFGDFSYLREKTESYLAAFSEIFKKDHLETSEENLDSLATAKKEFAEARGKANREFVTNAANRDHGCENQKELQEIRHEIRHILGAMNGYIELTDSVMELHGLIESKEAGNEQPPKKPGRGR